VDAALVHACQEFEAALLRPLLADAGVGKRASISADNTDESDGASQGDVVQSFFVDAMAAALAGAGGIGIGRELARALAR
jgi:hypothetical protein